MSRLHALNYEPTSKLTLFCQQIEVVLGNSNRSNSCLKKFCYFGLVNSSHRILLYNVSGFDGFKYDQAVYMVNFLKAVFLSNIVVAHLIAKAIKNI
jgi:hypothetical protein